MSIKLGSVPIADLMLGTTPIYWVFQGTIQVWARELVVVLGAGVNVDLKAVIENAKAGAWADVNLAKRVVVPSGVEIGATTSAYAIRSGATSQADSWAGSLTLEIRGVVSGIGGAANSGVGGNAINIPFPGRNGEKITILYYGTLRAGGGGGGRGGNGGQGYTSSNGAEGPYFIGSGQWWDYQYAFNTRADGYLWLCWGGMIWEGYGGWPNAYKDHGAYRYYRVTDYGDYRFSVRRELLTPAISYFPGGVAPNAGKGQGFDGPATAGGAPVAGGTNSGASGKSGDGATYGNTGQTGSNGSNGNYSAGLAGAAGGLPGYYLFGITNAVLTNMGGTLLGRVA